MVSTRTTRSIYGFVLLSAIAVSVYPVSGFINVAKQSSLRSIHLQNLPYKRQRSRTTTSPTLCNSASDKSTDSGEKQDEKPSSSSEENFVTYYSPNVPLDQARYYNKDTDEDSTDLAGEIDPASSTNEYSFFDEAMIYVRGGSGGQGASTYKKGVGGQDGPPDGGNGGRGGNVLLIVDESLNTLAGLTNAWRPNSFGGSGAAASTTGPNSNNNSASRYKSFRAEHGMDGGRQQKSGRTGKDVMIRVPPGTVVQEVVSNEDNPMIDSTKELIDIGTLSVEEQPTLIVARGGEGGEGSAIGMKGGRGVRRVRIPPQGGDKKLLKLTLKIVADVALVGVPNAGKSTLLASVTRAKPKIANYPFTTVIPNLGVWIPPESSDFGPAGSTTGSGSDGLVLCDVPGLIAGAAKGVGLGHAFLRHVERCHVILHLVDATSIDPIADFHMLNQEIVNYGSGQLGRMPQVVVVNKVDALRRNDGDDANDSPVAHSADSSKGNSNGEDFYSQNNGSKNIISSDDWESGLQTKLTRDELEEKLKDAMSHSRLLWISAKEKEGVDDLMVRLASFVKKVKDAAP